jgi:hypothetical protein
VITWENEMRVWQWFTNFLAFTLLVAGPLAAWPILSPADIYLRAKTGPWNLVAGRGQMIAPGGRIVSTYTFTNYEVDAEFDEQREQRRPWRLRACVADEPISRAGVAWADRPSRCWRDYRVWLIHGTGLSFRDRGGKVIPVRVLEATENELAVSYQIEDANVYEVGDTLGDNWVRTSIRSYRDGSRRVEHMVLTRPSGFRAAEPQIMNELR